MFTSHHTTVVQYFILIGRQRSKGVHIFQRGVHIFIKGQTPLAFNSSESMYTNPTLKQRSHTTIDRGVSHRNNMLKAPRNIIQMSADR